MSIQFGSAQTGGMPVRVTATTQGTAQLLHTAPAGSATPHNVKILVNNLATVSHAVTVVIDDGATERLIQETVPVQPGLFPILQGKELPLNQGVTVSIFADTTDVIEAYAVVDNQADPSADGGSVSAQQLYSGLIDMNGVTSAARYRANGIAASATEADHQLKLSRAGVLRNLRAAPAAAVAGASSVTVTVRVNGADTALASTFVNGDGTADKQDTDAVTVSAGDLVTIEVEETAGVDPATTFQASVEFADA